MKIQVRHWLGKQPPCPGAFEENMKWYFHLNSIAILTRLLNTHDVKLLNLDDYDPERTIEMWVDQKGGYFRTR